MKICEIFGDSIQGEGPYIGVPAIFIRISGCIKPLCNFCDSKYSWKDGKNMTIKQIIGEIRQYKQKLVVITGGECYIQDDIYNLINALQKKKYTIQIETSGKVDIKKVDNIMVVCSPKQYNGKFIIKQSAIDNSDCFKFVVGNQKEMDNVIYDFLRNHEKIPTEKIYLMPKGISRGEQIKIMPRIVKWCCQHGFKMSPRLHVLIWDKKRGV